MQVRIIQSAAIDFNGDGRIDALIPGRLMTCSDEQGDALVAAGLALEADEEREPETATAAPQRKRR